MLTTRVKDVGQHRVRRASPPVRADGSGHHGDGTDGFRPEESADSGEGSVPLGLRPGAQPPPARHHQREKEVERLLLPPNVVTESVPLRPSPSSR